MTYVRSQPAIVALTVLAFLTTFLGLPLLTFLPVFARDIFHGDVGRYSVMMAFSGAGAVVGALVVAWLGRFKHMGLTLLLVQLTFGVLITAFALSRIVWLSYLLLFFTRRGAADRLLDDRVAGAADRPRPPARPRRQHLHGGVPRRDAARQPVRAATRRRSARRPTSSRSTARWSRSWRCTSWCAATVSGSFSRLFWSLLECQFPSSKPQSQGTPNAQAPTHSQRPTSKQTPNERGEIGSCGVGSALELGGWDLILHESLLFAGHEALIQSDSPWFSLPLPSFSASCTVSVRIT